MNKAMIMGRLGQDPTLEYLPSGSQVSEFSVATDESYKDRNGNKVDKAEWHRVKVYGPAAEFCSKWLAKGKRVLVEGKIATRSWEDQQGQKRYITEIIVSGPQGHITPIDWANSEDDQAQGGRAQQGAHSGQSRGAYQRPQGQGGYQQPQGQRQQPKQGRMDQGYGPGPAFPTEASGMDDVPF